MFVLLLWLLVKVIVTVVKVSVTVVKVIVTAIVFIHNSSTLPSGHKSTRESLILNATSNLIRRKAIFNITTPANNGLGKR